MSKQRTSELLVRRYREALRKIYDFAWDHRYSPTCYCGPCCMNRTAARALKKKPRNIAKMQEAT